MPSILLKTALFSIDTSQLWEQVNPCWAPINILQVLLFRFHCKTIYTKLIYTALLRDKEAIIKDQTRNKYYSFISLHFLVFVDSNQARSKPKTYSIQQIVKFIQIQLSCFPSTTLPTSKIKQSPLALPTTNSYLNHSPSC